MCSSRRRLRPGDDRVLQTDSQSVRNAMRSAQRSLVDPNDVAYETVSHPGLPNDVSMQSNHTGFFGQDSIMSNEQALVGMQGHTVDQYSNAPICSSSYDSRNVDGFTNGPANANCYGNDPSRLLTVLSEAADNLDYSGSASFMAAPKRSRSHTSGYEQSDVRYAAHSPQGQYPCQHPGCSKVSAHEYDLTYGHRLPSAS